MSITFSLNTRANTDRLPGRLSEYVVRKGMESPDTWIHDFTERLMPSSASPQEEWTIVVLAHSYNFVQLLDNYSVLEND